MRIFQIILIILLISSPCFSQLKDERLLNYVYGQGNGDISIVFEGSWETGVPIQTYNYQILPTDLVTVRDIDSSTFYGTCAVYRFIDHPYWACLKDQLLVDQTENITLEAAYHATTNPTRTDISIYNKTLQLGTTLVNGKEKFYGYIKPGTFQLTAGSLVVADNGSGQLIGNGTGTINYGNTSLASINLTFSSTVLKATPITVSFTFRNFPHQTFERFLQITDIPTGTYTFRFFNQSINDAANFVVDPKSTVSIKQDSNFIYSNQLISIQ